MPRDFDSDWDYYDSMLPKRRPHNEEEPDDDYHD